VGCWKGVCFVVGRDVFGFARLKGRGVSAVTWMSDLSASSLRRSEIDLLDIETTVVTVEGDNRRPAAWQVICSTSSCQMTQAQAPATIYISDCTSVLIN